MATALVLSAGGMFGAWQAGAWRALSREFRPDLVVGTSAGALNGWAIAGGCPPDELERHWLDPHVAGEMMRFRLSWRGLFNPGPLRRIVGDLFARYRPRVPFALTVVELGGLRLKLVRGDEIGPEHLLAACAVPTGFPPVKLDRSWCVDGGLLGALPLWAAAEMGADRALALDALPRMPSRLVRVSVGALRRVRPAPPAPPSLRVQHLKPSQTLGSLRDAVRWTAANAERWIDLGARDAASLRAIH